MSNSKALNDEEVAAEMKKMVAFIQQEANEKAREIRVKADEEFAIEKAKLVRQESSNIDALFEKKKKQVELQKKIEQSKLTNASRLRILETREQQLQSVVDEAKNKLGDVVKDEKKYGEILKGLILQGLLTLLEKDIQVIVKERDVKIAKKALEDAKSEYEKTTSNSIDATIVGELPEKSTGGVKLTGHRTLITVDNTLEARLSILEDTALPEIRTRLFGHSKSRKHFN